MFNDLLHPTSQDGVSANARHSSSLSFCISGVSFCACFSTQDLMNESFQHYRRVLSEDQSLDWTFLEKQD
jgi:hypothetical protein